MLAIQRFTVTGAIDAAFRVYRDHFKSLFLLSLIAGVPSTLGNLALKLIIMRLQSWTPAVGLNVVDPATGLRLLPLLALAGGFALLTFLVSIVVGMFALAATTRLASLMLLGQRASVADGVREALRILWPLLGASLLVMLVVSLGLVLFIVPGVVLWLGFAFVGPVVVLERLSAADALGRSWRLTSGRRWKILGAAVLYGLIFTSASGGLVLAGTLGGVFGTGTLLATVLETSLSQSISVLATPVWYVVAVLLYYDARVEQEGFDIQMLARSAMPPLT